jgi:hypothetical protein
MMEGKNSNGGNDNDNDNDSDKYDDNDNSIPSAPAILPIGRSYSSLSDWIGTKKQNHFVSRPGKRLDDTSTCCSTVCMEDSSSTFGECSVSSFRYTHKHVEVDDECEGTQGNYSASSDFNNSMNFTRRRAKIRAERKAIQPRSMSVKCLPRELEMKKAEKAEKDNTNRFN